MPAYFFDNSRRRYAARHYAARFGHYEDLILRQTIRHRIVYHDREESPLQLHTAS